MQLSIRSALVAAAIAGAVLWPGGLAAGAPDHDAVRQAVERGEIRSLSEILAAIRDKLPGEVVRVEVEQKRGRWIYEFRVVDGKGRLLEVHVDARTAEIERIREK